MVKKRQTGRRAARTKRSRDGLARKALRHGRQRADTIVAIRRTARRRGKGLPGANGVLVAEGDSWFDYPFYDVLGMLEDEHNFRVESVAHKGDTIEEMAYDDNQLDGLDRKLQHLQNDGRVPRAFLLSGGGNDIAGEEFAVLLNHRSSSLGTLNPKIIDGIINERVRFAFLSVIATMTQLSKLYFSRITPIVLHGYSYPVPDGRGYLGGAWLLPGPWLEPGFRQKGYLDLTENTAVMVNLIDTFNRMLATLPGEDGLEHVSYLDLRAVLSNELAGRGYKKSWENELHPTRRGFESVANQFSRRLLTL
jgi:lysophospholipase L1-like esterase